MKVYLAGGMRTNWQAKVIGACKGLKFINPCDKPNLELTLYGTWDLHAIKQSDIVFGYMEKTNPSGIGLAAELGFAFGLGKTVILALEPENETQKDKYLQFLKKVANVTFENFPDAIDYLKTFEVM